MYTLADESVPDAACATFATASEGDGVIVKGKCAKKKHKDCLREKREFAAQSNWVGEQ